MSDSISLAYPITFVNYAKVITSSGLLQAFLNSLYLSVLNVVFTLMIAIIIGYFFARFNFRFKKVLNTLFIAGMVIPLLSLLIPVFIEFKFLGLLDMRLSLLLPYIAFSMPLSIILVENYMKSIPIEMDEAAYLEGCSTMQLLSKIIFPLCKPISAILVINSFMGAWNEFPFALVLTKSDHLRTLSVAIQLFGAEHNVDYPLYMAALIITIIPVLTVYIAFSKQIMEGMTVGAVKG